MLKISEIKHIILTLLCDVNKIIVSYLTNMKGKRKMEMDYRFDNIPMIGILSQVAHLSGCYAKQSYEMFDLKPWQAGILIVLSMDGELSQRELANKLNQTPPSVTTAIQKMEKLGYITRTPDPEDQRILRLRLTDKSREYLEHIREATEQIEERILKGMNIEEKLLFRRLLMQVRDNLLEETDTDFFKAL